MRVGHFQFKLSSPRVVGRLIRLTRVEHNALDEQNTTAGGYCGRGRISETPANLTFEFVFSFLIDC